MMFELSPLRVTAPSLHSLERSKLVAIKKALLGQNETSHLHKQTKQIISLVLEHGSLLIMKDTTQTNWLHSLPKSKSGTQPRIYLTFQTIVH
jgi:alkylated DNA repair dioxygenase AlkB